jgi:DNA-binding Lrp family transcriptional regulator
MDVRLNNVDHAILQEIDENGRATVGLLTDVVGKSRSYTSRRTQRLREHELLNEVAPNLYDLTDKGRERLQEAPA